MKFVIKLFPEITIKSRPVRKQFINQLKRNIKQTLAYHEVDSGIQGSWDNIEVNIKSETEESVIREILKRITGIHSILTVKNLTLKRLMT